MHGPVNVKRVNFISLNCPHMYATCFDLYLGHPQACQYKNIYSNIQQKSKGPLFTVTVTVILLICNRVLCLVTLVLSYSFVFTHIRVLKGLLSKYACNVISIIIILYPSKWVIFYYPGQQMHNIYTHIYIYI